MEVDTEAQIAGIKTERLNKYVEQVQQLHKIQKDAVSISSFGGSAKFAGKADSDDEKDGDSSFDKDDVMTVDFSHGTRNMGTQSGEENMFENLTKGTQSRLEYIESSLMEQEINIEKAQILLEGLPIRLKRPIITAKDFDELYLYNEEVCRLSASSLKQPLSGGKIALSNLTTIVLLSLLPEEKTYLLETVYRASEGDLLTCLGEGSGIFRGYLLFYSFKGNCVKFFDIKRRNISFSVELNFEGLTLENTVVVALIASNGFLFVATQGESTCLLQIEIGSGELKKQFKLQDVREDDTPRSFLYIEDQKALYLLSTSSIMSIDVNSCEISRFANLQTDSATGSLAKSVSLKNGLFASAALDGDSIQLLSKEGQLCQVSLPEGHSLIDIGATSSLFNTFVVLTKTSSGDETQSMHVQIIGVDYEANTADIQDSIEVNSSARNITCLATSPYIVVEGELTFEIYCLNDESLGTKIKEELVKKLQQVSVEEVSNGITNSHSS